MFFYVYILKLNNQSLYVGYTNNLKRRIREHQHNKVISTRKKHPRLIFFEAHLHPDDAKRRESYLKTTRGKRTLRLQLTKFLNSNG